MAAPDFWNSQEQARKVIESLKALKRITEPLRILARDAEELEVLLELAEEDESALEEFGGEFARLGREAERFELRQMLSGRSDHCNAFLSIHAGAGGTESCDWGDMLLRMYTLWCESTGRKHEIIEYQPGEEAGLKHATLKVFGDSAYGYLRGEIGVHRLVRISPFDANKRRHTSFCAVDVVPEIEDDIDIEVRPDELRVDTYRASGAGGQHVNKTSSAVRITHLPTGIVVQCQNQRSQHQNRRQALKMLTARLYQMREREREAEINKAYDEKGEIAWGNQIRSYVLQPYTLVKDLRTDVETGSVQAVLDGDIDRFLEAYLKWRMGQKSGQSEKSGAQAAEE